MRVRPTTIVCTLLLLGCASLISHVVRVLSVDVNDTLQQDNITVHKQNRSSDGLGSSDDNVLWFMQISDLHLSVFQDPTRGTELHQFASSTVKRINPSVVLASGDLTDAKNEDMLGSHQYVQEWITYYDALKASGVLNKTVWLDIRGNHDNFDVPSLRSPENLYQQYSVQGPHHPRSYAYTLRRGGQSVTFIGVDACLLPGPRRPFNFIGMVTPSEMRLLEEFERTSRRRSDYTVWFGHYPTSCILSPEPGIRSVMGGGLAYLCGHLHTLGGLVPNMYTRQHSGYLELELGDWKDNRLFRVAAIDHGLFSFIDVRHNTWPVILVTNPKHSLFAMEHNEPLHIIKKSTHIRVLVWSMSQIVEVKMRIGKGSWQSLTQVNDGPLFVTPWDPQHYITGLHTLTVFAKDATGREQTVVQPFSLDGSQPSFGFWPRAFLMSNVSMCFQFLFGVMVCVCVLPLCILRYVHKLVIEKRMIRPRKNYNVWLRKLWVLVTVDRIFWPLVLSVVYMPVGPWFVGEVIEDHIGAVFAWGIFVNKSYIPGSLTYAYGFIQILTFQFPLILAIAHTAEFRFQSLYGDPLRCGFPGYLCCHLCPILIVTIQMLTAYFFWAAYGTVAFFLGPLRTWSAILGLVLWYQCTSASKDVLRGAAQVWAPESLLREEEGGKT